jgi:hypothetical protein
MHHKPKNTLLNTLLYFRVPKVQQTLRSCSHYKHLNNAAVIHISIHPTQKINPTKNFTSRSVRRKNTNCILSTHNILKCSVRFLNQNATANISLDLIHRLVFLREAHCVVCELCFGPSHSNVKLIAVFEGTIHSVV